MQMQKQAMEGQLIATNDSGADVNADTNINADGIEADVDLARNSGDNGSLANENENEIDDDVEVSPATAAARHEAQVRITGEMNLIIASRHLYL